MTCFVAIPQRHASTEKPSHTLIRVFCKATGGTPVPPATAGPRGMGVPPMSGDRDAAVRMKQYSVRK
jgi:hypothetical protein